MRTFENTFQLQGKHPFSFSVNYFFFTSFSKEFQLKYTTNRFDYKANCGYVIQQNYSVYAHEKFFGYSEAPMET